jgi:pimeloyl-ACP methyl ester carboxylesterase
VVNGRPTLAGPGDFRKGLRVARVRSFDLRVPVPSAEGEQPGWEIAATVYLPAGDALPSRPAALVLMPGGGYGRRYFDLPVPGFSQAEHHARQGTVVVAIDHLGAGDSSVPPVEVTTLPTVAAANHAAVVTVLGRLRAGTLAPGVPSLDLAGVVGAGQSLGGHALAAMQAGHRTFDGVAMLGSSMAGTTMPLRPGAPEVAVPDGATPEQTALLVLANTDWNWVYHWQDASVAEPGPPHDLASLAAADIAAGLPARRSAPEWGSLTYPGYGAAMMLPGVMAGEAARIDVPVLLATGERDVCRPPAEEIATFTAATDISVFVVPRSAHMHNFAATRTLLWERLDEFVTHVTRRSRE